MSNSVIPPKVRFAPSPTGALHIGGARTALYNWLVARGGGGSLVLRIEDTDRERSTTENVAQILDALRWLELDWDEGPLSQAERVERHRDRIDQLLDADRAYRDTATGEEVAAWRQANHGRGYRGPASGAPSPGEGAVRLRVPDAGETVVTDLIRGEIRFDNRLQDDPVIARSDGSALYNFAVAVDDAEMEITDVIRGDDHLSNTPRQLLVFEALGIDPPRYAHLPLLHGPDGKKLSKRHGAASVQELRDGGYLPEAVRNYLALLGWGSTDDTDLISTPELVERFEIERVGRASAIFDEKKLRWMNGRYMRESDLDDYQRRLEAYLEANDPEAASAFTAAGARERWRACEIVQEKAQTMAEVWELIAFLFTEPAGYEEKAWKKAMKPRALEPLRLGGERLAGLEVFSDAAVERELRALMEERGVGAGALLQPIRVAITGKGVSPGIFESVAALGQGATLSRLDAAIERLAGEVGDGDQGGPGGEVPPEG